MSRCLNDCVALIGGDGWTANNDPFVLNDRHNRLHLSGAVCVLPSFFFGLFFLFLVCFSFSLSLSLSTGLHQVMVMDDTRGLWSAGVSCRVEPGVGDWRSVTSTASGAAAEIYRVSPNSATCFLFRFLQCDGSTLFSSVCRSSTRFP